MSRKTSPSDIVAIGWRLVDARDAQGLTQAELADKADIPRNTYNQWEPNKDGGPPKGRPNIDYAYRLCETLGYTLEFIYRGDDSRMPKDIVENLKWPGPHKRSSKK